jgi:glycerophosphoryl diester phosphodiesterase
VTQIFAHRGLHQDVRENTVEAFLEARVVGTHGIELDVRRSLDGALVIHHDAEIAEIGAIAELNCRDLPTYVPTFQNALDACEGLLVNVEIKNIPFEAGYDPSGALVAQVLQVITESNWHDDVIISSFDLATCESVRHYDPGIAVGWLLEFAIDTQDAISRVHDLGLNAVHPFFLRVDEVSMAFAEELGIAVNAWTVNGERDIRAMLDLGVDTIISDNPILALQLLGEKDHGR